MSEVDAGPVDATVESPHAVEPERAVLAPTSTALVDQQQREAGLSALSRMSEAEFVERLKALRLGLDRFDMMMREVLTTGKGGSFDLMIIDGVDKPVFTQSAAEKTCFVARLVPTFLVQRSVGAQGTGDPPIHYIVRTQLHLGNADGPVCAEGVGSCNSYEKKYRWRYADKICPDCGKVGSLLKSKHKDDRGPLSGTFPWFCWGKRGGCGKKFPETDARITGQTAGMVENDEPYDLDNTLLKMAKKRSYVDASKTATCASGRVTQDLEEGQAGSDDQKELLDSVYRRAKALGWTVLGPILEVARKTTKRPVRLKAELDALTSADLLKVLEGMPVPEAEKQAAEETPLPGGESEGGNGDA